METIRAELRHLATKEDLALLKSDLARLETRLTLRLIFSVAVIVGAVAAIVQFLE